MRWAVANLTELGVLGLLYSAAMAPVPLTRGCWRRQAPADRRRRGWLRE